MNKTLEAFCQFRGTEYREYG